MEVSDNFYPRPPRGGRPLNADDYNRCREFLSTPSARRATPGIGAISQHSEFLSTPSARRATRRWRCGGNHIFISIHALREEGDAACRSIIEEYIEFLSTPSARRATRRDHADQRLHHISIHALREEGDT